VALVSSRLGGGGFAVTRQNWALGSGAGIGGQRLWDSPTQEFVLLAVTARSIRRSSDQPAGHDLLIRPELVNRKVHFRTTQPL
jgi:hypothetical protein